VCGPVRPARGAPGTGGVTAGRVTVPSEPFSRTRSPLRVTEVAWLVPTTARAPRPVIVAQALAITASSIWTGLTWSYYLAGMGADEYSTYEAKARFSELLRKVRAGRTVTITYHGQAIAEVHPIRPQDGLEARIEALRAGGRIVGGTGSKAELRPVARRPGALDRFLAERE
jgi:prevent-host-death family protein